MRYIDRQGNMKGKDNKQDRLLQAMYTTKAGRFIVSLLVHPCISKLGGRLLSTRLSALAVPIFVRANNIDLSQFENRRFLSYNDFFTRKIKPGYRKIDMQDNHVIAPCDSKLSVYPVTGSAAFEIKNTKYTVSQLLRDAKLAKQYEGGYICIFRLSVEDYHRYCYIDDGIQTRSRYIQGVLHTVNPVANDVYPIYKENSRAYSILKSEHFGRVLMMEVGALLVGKIVNYKSGCSVRRGEEKGRFEFGGSTVILLFEKNRIVPDTGILNNTAAGFETQVRLGECFGKIFKKCLTFNAYTYYNS